MQRRATSVGEAVDVTCTEHNKLSTISLNKAKMLASFMRKRHPYSGYLDAIKDQTGLSSDINYVFRVVVSMLKLIM